MQTMKIRGRWYHEIPIDEVQPNDVVQVYDRGYRTRIVEAVHHGTKHHRVKTKASAMYPAQWHEFRSVLKAWRKGKK